MKTSLVKTMVLCCTMAALCACEKDQELSQNDRTIERLRTFRKQIDYVRANPGMKSEETLSLTEALWDVENHFNLTYSDVEQYYDEIRNHEFTLNLPVNGQQQVLLIDAVSLYEEMINQARTALQSDEFENKGFISLTIKEVNSNNRGTSITFSGKTGNRCTSQAELIEYHVGGPFDIDDNWMYASPMGKCDDPDIPSGADEQMQEKLYADLIEPMVKSTPEYRNIYTDRRIIIFDGTNYQGVYYNEDMERLCIDRYEMNDLYQAEKRIITQAIPNQYDMNDYVPISITINGIMTDDWQAVTHRNEIVYGKQAKVRIDEFGTVENLIP